jgi:L-seryl-tRNA(Ser) seleniumtransferase
MVRNFQAIPSIDALRRQPSVRELEERFGTEVTVAALRSEVGALRDQLATGGLVRMDRDTATAMVESAAAAYLRQRFRPSLQAVINATGVILHTNLGRAPLSATALEKVVAIARGYCTLEYSPSCGTRGRRDVHVESLLRELTGADAGVVVNNNAAAILLILSALAAEREVIVSRGELVEVGGGFRIPEVMAQSRAVLREVGTTNRTRAEDYERAINDQTALILRVHPSNFHIVGFTRRPSLPSLTEVGRRRGIIVAEDLGSGQLLDDSKHPLVRFEPSVRASVAAGMDICCFSGDKLLGGPQAGIIVGRQELIDRIRVHPLMRALRVDKMTYAALEMTLVEYVSERSCLTIPVQTMLAMSPKEISERAQPMALAIGQAPGWHATVRRGMSAVGGGSAPGAQLPTWLIAVRRSGVTASQLGAALRQLEPPVITRIGDDHVQIDLRTVERHQDGALLAAIVGTERLWLRDSGVQTEAGRASGDFVKY